MTREEFKLNLLEMLEEDETMANGTDKELIYIIDDIQVYGGFTYGMRSIDHNCLKFDDISWQEIMVWGTLIVPETKVYISDKIQFFFEQLGFTRLSKNANQFTGRACVA